MNEPQWKPVKNTKWKFIENENDVDCYYFCEPFNQHPDSPLLFHYGFRKDYVWSNYVTFKYDPDGNWEKYFNRFLEEYEECLHWHYSIQKMKDDGIIERGDKD